MLLSLEAGTLLTALALSLPRLAGARSLQKAPLPWSDLPWSALESRLSPSASLVQTDPAADYAAQCWPEYKKQRYPLDPDLPVRSHHNLVDQPSGLCMNQLYCAFERCNPLPLTEDEAAHLTVTEKWEEILVGPDNPDIEAKAESWLEASNPAYNLPSTVIFPAVAGDVVAAVDFARDHGIGLSVKNSGHSYTGASTKKDAININMNRFVDYSPTGIAECESAPDNGGDFLPHLADQPCRLARARGKPGALRIGGGENFSDVYLSVKSFNEAQPEGYKYHLVGGAAGTVSPQGWTWQGGLAGTTGGREHGFGVDQVLQIDMVLPIGLHVRFGPTEWEEPSEGYIYPKTVKVSGVCQANPEEADEAEWVWEDCPEDLNFDDLWFAMLGGGGGTWGVVTSVYLQLHEYGVFEGVLNGIDHLDGCGLPSEHRDIIEVEWWNFYIDFMFDPTSVGVTVEESNRCASSTYNYLMCYGTNSSEAYTSAWTRYIGSRNEGLVEAGVPISTIDLVAGCSGTVIPANDWADLILITEGPHKGKASDGISPSYASTSETDANVIVPAKYIVENKDAARKMVLDNEQAPYCAFGGNAGFAQDRANSLSNAHRLGGWMLLLHLETLTEEFYSEVFPKLFDTTDGDNFPGFIGGNHAGPNMRGPLKEDWTKPCPLDWTQQERDDKCISLQESLWGTKTLKRLESIKESLDPDFIFDCYGCVSNNRVRSAPEVQESVSSSFGVSLGLSAIAVAALQFGLFLAGSL